MCDSLTLAVITHTIGFLTNLCFNCELHVYLNPKEKGHILIISDRSDECHVCFGASDGSKAN